MSDERDKIIEAWIDCVSLFHDALFEPERLSTWRRTQLKQFVKYIESNRTDKLKLLKNRSMYNLMSALQVYLRKFMDDDKFTIEKYNNTIQTDKMIALYCEDLKLKMKYLILSGNKDEIIGGFKLKDRRGPQDVAIYILSQAAKASSVSGMSKTMQNNNLKKIKSQNRKFSGEYQKWIKHAGTGRGGISNSMDELNLLNNVFYQKQWFAKTDKVIEIKFVSKKK